MVLQYLKVTILYLVFLYKMDSNTSEEQDTHLHHYIIPQYILPPKIHVKNNNKKIPTSKSKNSNEYRNTIIIRNF